MAFLPDYWWPTDEATVVTQEASQLLRRWGSFSAHVVAPVAQFPGNPNLVDDAGNPLPNPGVIGSGLVSSPIAVVLTEEKPWLVGQVALWLVQGAVRLELWDVTDCANVVIWPPRESDLRSVTTETGVWVEVLPVSPGEDFFTGSTTGRQASSVQLAVIADVPDTEFYIDANMLLNSPDISETYFEDRASNVLLLAGNDELAIFKNPLSTFEMEGLELTRQDAVTWPSEGVEIGAISRLKVDQFGDLDVLPRITQYTKNLVKEAQTAVTFESEQQKLTRIMAATQRKRRRLRAPHPEQTNRPANVTGLAGAITN